MTTEAEKYKEALEAIARLEGLTLLGCADEDCDSYPHCDEREKRAHERGAWRAFNEAAGIAKYAISGDTTNE